ncbi:MAG: mechanosensitive ion channel family protein [Gammaproteobacteria bacterium]|nr:mechanosensitive ion channel family protein [Gammaproteobacteria bacterium]
MNLLERSFYGNTVYDWTVALTISLGLALLFQYLKRSITRRLLLWSQGRDATLKNFAVDIFSCTRFLFLFILAIYLGSQYLELPLKPERLITRAAVIALLIQLALWGNRAIVLWFGDYLKRYRETDAASATTMSVLGFISQVVLWSVLLLMILENLGFNITTLLASLGIGGIAVALAMQNILGDIFASLSIAIDKPFVIGDFIVVDNIMGTVEYIGLKTTRLRSLSGEQIIFSNTDLLKSRIHNHKRMFERRVVFGFGIPHQALHEKVEQIPAMVREIIETQAKTRFDRAHFKEYTGTTLNFEAVYFVQDPDYNLYMDIQQAINLALFSRLQQASIQLVQRG